MGNKTCGDCRLIQDCSVREMDTQACERFDGWDKSDAAPLAAAKAGLTIEDGSFRLRAKIAISDKVYNIDQSVPVKTVVMLVVPMLIPASKAVFLKYLPR